MFLRSEDLFIALVFAVVAAVCAWAVVDADDASPLVSSTAVVMERSVAADEAQPVERTDVQVAAHSAVCPCCAATIEPRLALTAEPRHRTTLPPRPTFLN